MSAYAAGQQLWALLHEELGEPGTPRAGRAFWWFVSWEDLPASLKQQLEEIARRSAGVVEREQETTG